MWEQKCFCVFYYFNFGRSYDVWKSKSSCILKNKKRNFNKNGTDRKWKISFKVLERQTLCFCSYKNEMKSKNVMSWSSRKGIFWTVYFVRKESLYNLRLISMYSILNTFSEYNRIYFYILYQKTSLQTILLLVSKIVESLQCILKE